MPNEGLQNGVTEPNVSPPPTPHSSGNNPSAEAVRVLRLLGQLGFFPLRIAQILKKSRKNTYKHINNLIKSGFYVKGEGVTREGYNVVGYGGGVRAYRINGVQVFFELPGGVDRVKWRRYKGRVLSLRKIQFDSLLLGLKERYERFFLFDRFDCRVHSTGVLVYFPNVFGSDGLEAELVLLGLIRQVGEGLSNIFKGIDFLTNNMLKVRIVKYELAHVNDSIAKEFRREGKKLHISIDGQLRLICDFSWKIDELETVTVEHGLEDQFAVQSYIKDILKQGKDALKPSDALRLFEFQARVNSNFENSFEELKKLVQQQNDLNFLLNENLNKIIGFEKELLALLRRN